VRLREALASSYNVPAVRMLDEVGSSELLELLHAAGISTLREPASTYGLGLTLGVGEVTLLDLCRAYALFPRGGRAMGLRAVAEVRDRQGAVMRRPDAPGAGGPRRSGLEEALLPARAAFWVTDILADPEARIGGFGPHGPLEMPFVVAAKTGTSSDYRDAWTVGFDRRYVVGVWVGNLAGEPPGPRRPCSERRSMRCGVGRRRRWHPRTAPDRVTTIPRRFSPLPRPTSCVARSACSRGEVPDQGAGSE
jgi:penicillin-binding protein 1C